jgi:2-amino-4-hydroxy-6-hydroxymethyldihydropteridine diphosphokinase
MKATQRQAFIGMGANLGDRFATLSAAIQRLPSQPTISKVQSSSVYETDPVGEIAQPMYLNLVVGVETSLSPEELLGVLMTIEREFGRVRKDRWGPRTLDLDLLAYERETRSSTSLELPHPRMLERGFVVVPFRELLSFPRFRKKVWDDLRTKLSRPIGLEGVRLFAPPLLPR